MYKYKYIYIILLYIVKNAILYEKTPELAQHSYITYYKHCKMLLSNSTPFGVLLSKRCMMDGKSQNPKWSSESYRKLR